MTLDCKKNANATKWRIFEKRNQKLKNLMIFGVAKLYFSSNHKTGGSLYGKTNTQ